MCLHGTTKNKEGVLPMTTPPELGSLIMQLHRLLRVSHQNQRHLCAEVWTKRVRWQRAVFYIYFKNTSYFKL